MVVRQEINHVSSAEKASFGIIQMSTRQKSGRTIL